MARKKSSPRARKAPRKTKQLLSPKNVPVGVVGLGLMGTSVTTCLLAAGHPVCAVEPNAARRRSARRRILALLKQLQQEKMLKVRAASCLKRLTVAKDAGAQADCRLVMEAVPEDIRIKQAVFRQLEAVLAPSAIIGTNTSAIPITNLQRGARRPARIVGIHWGEPAHVNRFLEIICGDRTKLAHARTVLELSRHWGKEASLIRKDIRGFITNRCFYALLREAFHLVESGVATFEDVDRSLRNDLGFWITLAGPFRYLDLTGIPAYRTVMKDLWPELSNAKRVPKLMEKLVSSGAQGVSNAKGFYDYTPAQARAWEKLFLQFNYDIRKLAQKYPADLGDRPPK